MKTRVCLLHAPHPHPFIRCCARPPIPNTTHYHLLTLSSLIVMSAPCDQDLYQSSVLLCTWFQKHLANISRITLNTVVYCIFFPCKMCHDKARWVCICLSLFFFKTHTFMHINAKRNDTHSHMLDGAVCCLVWLSFPFPCKPLIPDWEKNDTNWHSVLRITHTNTEANAYVIAIHAYTRTYADKF